MHRQHVHTASGTGGGAGGPPLAVLLLGAAEAVPELSRALDAEGPDAFRVFTAEGVAEGGEALRNGTYDAVLLVPESREDAQSGEVLQILDRAGAAAVIIAGPGPAVMPAAEREVDGWISASDSPEALVRCIRVAVERRRAREHLHRRLAELEESVARLNGILQRTADGIIIVDEAGRVRFVNPAAEQLFGRPASELLDEEFGIALVSGETTEMDIVRQGEADLIVAELRVNATTWDGAPAQLIALRDITDRKRAEERARRLMVEKSAREHAEKVGRRSGFLAEAGAALDASLDPTTTIVNLARLIVPRMADWCVIDIAAEEDVQRAVARHADERKQPLLDELRERYRPRPGSAQPASRVLESGHSQILRDLTPDEVRKRSLDDEHARLILALGCRSAMAVPIPARDQVIGTITFVCGERNFEEDDVALGEELAVRAGAALENARLYEAALAAGRAKSDFLALMSHELRTPLNAILGFVDLLLAGVSGTLDEIQNRQLQRIHSNATQLLQIISEILVYAGTESGRIQLQLSEVAIGELIEEVVAVAEPIVRDRGLDFQLDLRDAEALVLTDGSKLRQILLNLLTNAAKFTREGRVSLASCVQDGEIRIEVRDTGIGIAPETLRTIFEPFWQGDEPLTRSAGGTGLGLSLSRRLAELLGGSIDAVSEIDSGSTFTVRVPARLSPT